MPWSIPIPMLVSGDAPLLEVIISSTAQDYDLFAAAGSPAFPVDLYVTLNTGVVIDSMTAEGFAFGSNIFFTVLGTIRGRSAAGGDGGNAESGNNLNNSTQEPGLRGAAGGHAFLSTAGIHLYLNVDDGYIWGGGGGGGGGGGLVVFVAGVGVPSGGCGGGASQGWNQSLGGVGGTATASNGNQIIADVGGIGNSVGPGAGGQTGVPGGAGGEWGAPGSPGVDGRPAVLGGFGGTNGRAILVTGGSFVTLTGGKDIATLEAEGRIRGGIVSG